MNIRMLQMLYSEFSKINIRILGKAGKLKANT